MKKIIINICGILAVGFIVIIAYSGYQLWKINTDYAKEAEIHKLVLEYKPEQSNIISEEIVNQNVIDLRKKYPDLVGWVTIPNTKIDYPFLQYKDNDYYLRRDINGVYGLSGTIFMDYRCEKDFTSQNNIIYGHHMKNESMFGSLNLFNDSQFFNENMKGIIYLPNDTLMLEIFAYMVVSPNNKEIYNPVLSDTYFEYVKKNARYYRDMELTNSTQIVTFSTCSYEFDDARMVILAKIV